MKLKNLMVALICILLLRLSFETGRFVEKNGGGLIAPQVHAIAYPPDYPTVQDEDGASAFAGSLDHPGSDYYTVRDFHGLESGGTLHMLTGFDTYLSADHGVHLRHGLGTDGAALVRGRRLGRASAGRAYGD